MFRLGMVLASHFTVNSVTRKPKLRFEKSWNLILTMFVPGTIWATTLHIQLRYPEAEAAYRKALELDPDYVNAWSNLGSALAIQQRYPEAEAAYLKSLELDTYNDYAYCGLAALYLMEMGRIEAGINALSQGLQLNPDNFSGNALLIQKWQSVLKSAVSTIAANESGTENFRAALTGVLISVARSDDEDDVLNALLALDDNGQAIFEPLLLALQALKDRAVLYRIAREKRELVLDVMARIDGENTLQQQSGNLTGGARDGDPFEQTVVDK